MSDKELDDLFKDASGKMDTPFEASDWQKMEVLLDTKGGIRPAFWNWRTYTLATLLLLLGTTATVVLMNTESKEGQLSSQGEKITWDKSLPGKSGNESNVDSVTPIVTKKERPAEPDKEIGKPVVVQNVTVHEPKELRTNGKKVVLLKNRDNSEFNQTLISSNETMKASVSDDSSEGIVYPKDENAASTDSALVMKPAEEPKAKDSSEDKTSEKSHIDNHSFSLKAAISPDYSSVGYFTPGETGFNYGLLAEYGLGEHFSVSAGAMWSKKLYANESAEAPIYGQVLNSKKIAGDCRILDIPILVNYYFNHGHRFTVYGSAGLSSYIMFKEVYNYEVVKDGKSYDYTTSVEKENNEWFKMANISMGLQYRLTNQWSLQAEPFVKAPLAGIGEGDIKLVSSGVFINIKYTFK